MTSAIATAVQHVGGPVALAKVLGVTPSAVSQLVSGRRPMPPDRCPEIELATLGKSTCEGLRPDLRWVRICDPAWPNPAGRPLLDLSPTPADTPVSQAVPSAVEARA